MVEPATSGPASARAIGRLALKAVLVAVVLYLLWRYVDWARVWSSLRTMSPGALLLAVALARACLL
jgi:uncharacterized membrane protein YbhN (UPF0104 family)